MSAAPGRCCTESRVEIFHGSTLIPKTGGLGRRPRLPAGRRDDGVDQRIGIVGAERVGQAADDTAGPDERRRVRTGGRHARVREIARHRGVVVVGRVPQQGLSHDIGAPEDHHVQRGQRTDERVHRRLGRPRVGAVGDRGDALGRAVQQHPPARQAAGVVGVASCAQRGVDAPEPDRPVLGRQRGTVGDDELVDVAGHRLRRSPVGATPGGPRPPGSP